MEQMQERKQMKDGRLICSPDNPMPKDAPGRWAHTTVREIGTRWDGDVAVYQCRDCGCEWEAELPR